MGVCAGRRGAEHTLKSRPIITRPVSLMSDNGESAVVEDDEACCAKADESHCHAARAHQSARPANSRSFNVISLAAEGQATDEASKHQKQTEHQIKLGSTAPAADLESCPGNTAEAGRAAVCAGCPGREMCQSASSGVDPDLEAIKIRMGAVKHKVLVLSGKGGQCNVYDVTITV